MDKAQDLLDWRPQIHWRDGIKSCEPYLREQGLLR
jgi:nucleoside-diphosphate-sugar epimerase